ncbi:hypothetical protein BH11ARM1_BH11ARM1_09860 [soil metagenome]
MLKVVFGLLTLATVASSQAQFVGEDRILQAFDKLRTEDQLYLFTEGSETTGSVTKQLATHVYWKYENTGETSRARMEVLQYQDGILLHRIVADGENVYDYQPKTAQYSVTNYGGFGAARSSTYVRDMLQYVNRLSQGQEAFPVRLMREMHAEDSTVYRSWMPGIEPKMLGAGVTPDPIYPTRTYTDTASVDFLQYDSEPKRTITFELDDDSPSDAYKLGAVSYSEDSMIGGKHRISEWKITPFPGLIDDDTLFRPYAADQIKNWRPILGQAAFKG